MKCHGCGNEKNKETANFCKECGAKLRKECWCWLKNGDSYDCGESSCPGYGLYKNKLLQSE